MTNNELPLRTSGEIQGNILSAFNKDHMSFLLLNFRDSEDARRWLREVEPQVATAKQVEDVNEEYSRARQARGGDDPPMKAVWVNVGLTIDGLRTLSTDFQRLSIGLRNPTEDRRRGFEAFQAKPRDPNARNASATQTIVPLEIGSSADLSRPIYTRYLPLRPTIQMISRSR